MNKLASMPTTASVQDIQRNYRKLFDQVKATRSPLFVLRNNVAEAVIIDVLSWNNLAKKVEEMEEKDALESIEIARREFKSGKAKVLKGKLSDLMK
ncbi:MAG: type II toxin-antitoxin system Phd/YefM family antitoxin [Patescibacteria group bacterium]